MFKRAIAAVILLATLAGICNAAAAGASEESIAVSMTMDRDEYPSSLFIRCKADDLGGVKFGTMKEDGNAARKGFIQLMSAVRDNDAAKFMAMGKGFGNTAQSDKTTVLAKMNLAGYRGVLQSYDKRCVGLRIYKHLLMGNGGMFLWGSDPNVSRPESFTQRLATGYEKASSGEIRWDTASEQPSPLAGIITDAIEGAATHPKIYASRPKPTRFDYSLVISGTEGENPAYLQFSGKVYDNLDVLHGEIPADDAVLNFYKKAYLTLQAKSGWEFAQCYTIGSKKAILESFTKNASMFDNVKKDLSIPRHVIFVMDASPFYVVFYKSGQGESVDFEYVVRDPSDGQLRLTNRGVYDLTTQYMMSKEFYSTMNKIKGGLFPVEASDKK